MIARSGFDGAPGKPDVVLLVGPTAVGKTQIGLLLAERLDAEIVSIDSRLFYRGMDIGTAKPSASERARVPHHLIDIADPDQTLSLAEFQRRAQEAIVKIVARGRLPVLVGGTGQYVRAVISGWSPPRVAPQSRLRAELMRLSDERGSGWLHAGLREMDPSAAEKIDPRNARRTIRAMEVIFSTGLRFSEQRGHREPPYALITVGLRLPRTELYLRVDARIEEMWTRGLLEETRRLLDAGYSPGLPSMSAIGYGECVKVIMGELSVEGAKAEMRRATRAFVRRQSNWFKDSDPDIQWFDANDPGATDRIRDYLQGRLRARTMPDASAPGRP